MPTNDMERLTAMVEALTAQVNTLNGDKHVLSEQVNDLLRRPKHKDNPSAPFSVSNSASDPALMLKMLQESQDRGEEKILRTIAEVSKLFSANQQSFIAGLEAGQKIRTQTIKDHQELIAEIGDSMDAGPEPEPEDPSTQAIRELAAKIGDKLLSGKPSNGNGNGSGRLEPDDAYTR